MSQYPDWVPDEVVSYYQNLCAGTDLSSLEQKLEKSDSDALQRCMEAQEMEKAWQAVVRRKSKLDPKEFAVAIAIVAFSCRIRVTNYSYPTREEIAKYEKLQKKLSALRRDFEDAFAHWREDHLIHFFGKRPSVLLLELEDRLSHAVFSEKLVRKSLKRTSGKPLSESGERTYIIRSLSQTVRRLYGQPLHRVVALTSGAILQESIEEETVRKLVRKMHMPLEVP